jgi:hypothetical protein
MRTTYMLIGVDARGLRLLLGVMVSCIVLSPAEAWGAQLSQAEWTRIAGTLEGGTAVDRVHALNQVRTARPEEVPEAVRVSIGHALGAYNDRRHGDPGAEPEAGFTEDDITVYGDLILVAARLQDARFIPALVDAMDTGRLAMDGLLALGLPAAQAVLDRLGSFDLEQLEGRAPLTYALGLRVLGDFVRSGPRSPAPAVRRSPPPPPAELAPSERALLRAAVRTEWERAISGTPPRVVLNSALGVAEALGGPEGAAFLHAFASGEHPILSAGLASGAYSPEDVEALARQANAILATGG